MNRGIDPLTFESAAERVRRLESVDMAALSGRIAKVYLGLEENRRDIERLKELQARLEKAVLRRWL